MAIKIGSTIVFKDSSQMTWNILNSKPDIISTLVKTKTGDLTVQYERLVPLLIASIKELTERIEILENGTQNWKCNCSK